LLAIPQLWVVCALSFHADVVARDVQHMAGRFHSDAGRTGLFEPGARRFLATPFDLFGALGIVAMGLGFTGGLKTRAQVLLVYSARILLAGLIYIIPAIFGMGLGIVTAATIG
jgi:hypothetical protein